MLAGVGDDDNGDDSAKQSYVGIDDDDDLDEQQSLEYNQHTMD